MNKNKHHKFINKTPNILQALSKYQTTTFMNKVTTNRATTNRTTTNRATTNRTTTNRATTNRTTTNEATTNRTTTNEATTNRTTTNEATTKKKNYFGSMVQKLETIETYDVNNTNDEFFIGLNKKEESDKTKIFNKDKLISDITKLTDFNNYKKMISSIKSQNIINNTINESNNFTKEIIKLTKTTEYVLNIDENYILEFKCKDSIINNKKLIDLDISDPNDYLLIKDFLASLYNYTNTNNQLNYFEYNKAVNEIENSIVYLFLTPFNLDEIYSIFKLGYTGNLEQRTKELYVKFGSTNLLLLMAIKVKSRSIEEFIHDELIKMYSELVSHITVKKQIANKDADGSNEKIDKKTVWKELYIIHPKIIFRTLSIIQKAKLLENTRMEELKTIQEKEKTKQEQYKQKQAEELTKQKQYELDKEKITLEEQTKHKQAEELTKQKQAEELTKQKQLEELTKQKQLEEQTKQKQAEELTKQKQYELDKEKIILEQLKIQFK